MNPSMQDDAALFALGLMDPEESRTFEQHLHADPELAALVDELRNTSAELALAVPSVTPPPDVKARIMGEVAAQRHIRILPSPPSLNPPVRRAQFPLWNVIGWGLAASLAVSTTYLGVELQSTRQLTSGLRDALHRTQADGAEATQALIALREQNMLSRMEIATLRSSLEDYQQGVAVVVWNSDKREGVLKLEKMPPLDPQKDYQLWVVDTKNPLPVNAGVVKVDQQGFAQIDFKPLNPVTEATKFALSVERKGGVPRGEGPIVFIGP